MEEAEQAYREALLIYRRLSQIQPAVYEPDVTGTLNNLGAVLRNLRRLEEAEQAHREALALRERHGLWLDSTGTYYNWGILEEARGNPTRVLELFEACVERCERGLNQLAEQEHRAFKGMFFK